MAQYPEHSCADCGSIHCDGNPGPYPPFCPTTRLTPERRAALLQAYSIEPDHSAALASALVECEAYCERTRVEETMAFARKLGVKRVGVATCVGLIHEARTLAQILRANGFEVVAVGCKAGAIPKIEAGIDPQCCAVGENMCNPILQAWLLNEAGTGLNIALGLCVGHDSLFYRHSEALVTTLAAKDRVLGHNPLAALYTAQSYYRKKLMGGAQ